ncbi:alpha/beta fold hydrolase [Nocardia sp. NBC_00511]|uniref:alpha/beta fold hydrolase n=1 Tax=Nocardia sp. NBC_00511 TaxID=2903591 RepID=UPI0030E3E5A5
MSTSFIVERRADYAGFRTRELAVAGHGPTVLFVHGFGHASECWVQVLEMMHEAGRAAVAVDLPGFGGADPLAPGELLSQLDMFLVEVIRRYGAAEGVVVVGNSLGAALAARAGRHRDLPVTAVMALDIAGITWKKTVSVGLGPLLASSGLLAPIGVSGRLYRACTQHAMSHLLYGRRSAVDPEVVAQLAEVFPDLREAHRLFRLGARFKAELDRTREHGGVRVPLVIVHGARDRLVPISASRTLHAANPGSRLVVLPHSGHCPQLDAATVIAQHARELAGMTNHSREIS